MFRIAFIIGLILTAFSLSVTASPLPQQEAKKKQADDNYTKTAKQIIARYDTNDDKKLNKQEWQKMLLSPAKADANQDQQITVEEYAKWARSNDLSGKTQPAPPTKSKPKTSPEKASPKKAAQNQKTKPQQKNESRNEDKANQLREQREQLENLRNQQREKQAQQKEQ